VLAVVRIRLPTVVTQKGDVTNTIMSFDPRQRRLKIMFDISPNLEWNIFWITDFNVEELTGWWTYAATENSHNNHR